MTDVVEITNVIFFVKQKTAYEMRISDWSSDVCSSDLERRAKNDGFFKAGMRNRTTTAIKRHFYETEHRASATRCLCLSAGTNGPHTPNQHLTDPAIAVPRTYYRDGREPAPIP